MMVNPVSSGGYQAYAYQQQTTPVQEQRGGDNRVEKREAPAADSQRSDQRTSRNEDVQTRPAREERAEQNDNSDRGTQLDVTV